MAKEWKFSEKRGIVDKLTKEEEKTNMERKAMKPREVRCITYNIPAGVIYFFPKETDAIKFSKDRIAHEEEYGFQDLKNDVEKEFGKTEKCKHDRFNSLLQCCRDCGMAAIDIEIERSNNFKRKCEAEKEFMPKAREIILGTPWKSCVGVASDADVKKDLKNYCEPGDVLSRCKAGTNWKEHQRCLFSKKATRAEKCMYFRDFNDVEHCDNHLAQKASYLSTE